MKTIQGQNNKLVFAFPDKEIECFTTTNGTNKPNARTGKHFHHG